MQYVAFTGANWFGSGCKKLHVMGCVELIKRWNCIGQITEAVEGYNI